MLLSRRKSETALERYLPTLEDCSSFRGFSSPATGSDNLFIYRCRRIVASAINMSFWLQYRIRYMSGRRKEHSLKVLGKFGVEAKKSAEHYKLWISRMNDPVKIEAVQKCFQYEDGPSPPYTAAWETILETQSVLFHRTVLGVMTFPLKTILRFIESVTNIIEYVERACVVKMMSSYNSPTYQCEDGLAYRSINAYINLLLVAQWKLLPYVHQKVSKYRFVRDCQESSICHRSLIWPILSKKETGNNETENKNRSTKACSSGGDEDPPPYYEARTKRDHQSLRAATFRSLEAFSPDEPFPGMSHTQKAMFIVY